MKFWKCWGAIIAFFLVASNTVAQVETKMTAEEAKVKQRLEQKLPGFPIDRVTKTNLFGGLYEIVVDGQIIYTNSATTHLFAGAIVDITHSPSAQTNVTEQRMKELFRVDVSALPLDAAFKRVKGNGSRVIYLFSDIDCPFCAVIEKSLAEMDNLTIYTFLYPLAELHPDAISKSKKIWCAPDRAKAWEAYFATKTLPNNAGDCATPFDTVQSLAKRYNIRGTPGLIFADGQMVAGAVPKEQLEQALTLVAEKMKKK